jgi:carbon storage regulator
MLVIARRKGQRVVIGDAIEVVVTQVSGHTVKLGIQAPAELIILRGEIREAIEEANRLAAQSGDMDPAALTGANASCAPPALEDDGLPTPCSKHGSIWESCR